MKRCGEGYKRQGKKSPYIGLTIDLGVLGTVKAMMFINEKKKEANDPDYSIVIADDFPTTSAPRPPTKPVSTPKPQAAPYKKPVIIPIGATVDDGPDSPPPDLWDQGF